MSSIFQASTNKMKVPAFVLDPRSFFEGKEAYISIDKIEPESDLAQAVTTGFAKLLLTFRLT